MRIFPPNQPILRLSKNVANCLIIDLVGVGWNQRRLVQSINRIHSIATCQVNQSKLGIVLHLGRIQGKKNVNFGKKIIANEIRTLYSQFQS